MTFASQNQQVTWTGVAMEASAISIKRCPHCKTLIVVLEALDGKVFAQAHVDSDALTDMLETLAELLDQQDMEEQVRDALSLS